jgi:2,5-furandicarboxylate decarboxylase 1
MGGDVLSVDLRGFLESIRQEHPDEICEIDRPVDLEYQMTAYAIELERHHRYPLLFFKQVKGFDYPVVVNTFASRRRIGLGIGLEEKDLVSGWTERASKRLAPVESAQAPVKEVVCTGNEIDLQRYPIPVHFEVDAGRYITGGVVVAKDPDTGVGNLNFTRMQVQGRAKFGASLHSRGDLWDFQRRQEERGKPLEVAVLIGVHPAISVAGATRLPVDEDEMELAGALMGQPVPIVPAETVDLMVPAHAEMVIEGYIEPGVRGDEGPFGEYTGYASARSTRHVFQVTAITHRRDMIFQDVVPGASAEHLNLSKVSRIPRTFEAVKKAFPNVVDMNYPMSGTHYHCYLSMRKTMEGQPKQAMLLLFGLDMYLKHIIVVDEDVDVYDEQQVLWALATRFQADRDLFVVPGVTSNLLDPSLDDSVGAKMGMDATQLLESQARTLHFSDDILNRVRDDVNRILDKK